MPKCPICYTQMIRSTRNARQRKISLKGVQPPLNAFFPDLSIIMYAVWCPICGRIEEIDAPEVPLIWRNMDIPEMDIGYQNRVKYIKELIEKGEVPMEQDEAIDTVKALISGRDPITGNMLPENSPCHHPRVIRALLTVLNCAMDHNIFIGKRNKANTNEEKQQKNIKAGRPKNSGLPWTTELKEKLALKFKNNEPIDKLAEYFGRTRGAIIGELEKQGIISRDQAVILLQKSQILPTRE